MLLATRLKIWTIVSHACIIIGLGHGILPLGIAEFYWLSTLFGDNHYTSQDGNSSIVTLQLVSLLCVSGQLAAVVSLFLKKATASKWIYITCLCLLWSSVVTYSHDVRNDKYVHIMVLSCLPFAFCTLLTLLGGFFRPPKENS